MDHLDIENCLTADPEVIKQADGLILPGVGAFAKAMQAIASRNLVEVLQTQARAGQPMLGICLGMQLLFDRSEEFGETQGLGLLPGAVVAIPEKPGLKVPHMAGIPIMVGRLIALVACSTVKRRISSILITCKLPLRILWRLVTTVCKFQASSNKITWWGCSSTQKKVVLWA